MFHFELLKKILAPPLPYLPTFTLANVNVTDDDSHFFFFIQLDIVQQEYIYQEGLDQFDVVRAALDVRGSWLATVEERGSKGSNLEFSLKLWGYDEKAQRYAIKVPYLYVKT